MQEYLRNAFLPKAAEPLGRLPLPDESHIASWRDWLEEEDVTTARLAERLPQLMFGIHEGLSQTPEYKRAILSAELDDLPESAFKPNGSIEILIEQHWAGHLPVIRVTDRSDFEYLFASLANRGEPINISPQVHASMIAGLISPGRLAEARRAWEEGSLQADPLVAGCTSWGEAMQALDKRDRTRFRERILITHDVEYAGLRPEDVDADLDEGDWLHKSQVIRLEHEFTHYATRRMFDNMRLNLHDELVADCMGFTTAFDRFDSSLFLRGLGIDESLQPRDGGRVWMYVPGLDASEVPEVCAIAAAAAQAVEAVLDRSSVSQRALLMQGIASLALQDLAAADGQVRLEAALAP